MKKILVSLIISLFTSTAFAGGGLSLAALKAFANGNTLSAAIDGGLGAFSIVHGVNLINRGRVGWGVFFIVLNKEGIITDSDLEILVNADVAQKQAFFAIMESDLSAEQKEIAIDGIF